jgi:hypothetical protein
MQLMVIADPLAQLDPETDTTLGLIRAALHRGHRVRHCEIQDLAIAGGQAQALAAEVGEPGRAWVGLSDHDAILFRTRGRVGVVPQAVVGEPPGGSGLPSGRPGVAGRAVRWSELSGHR